MLAKKLRELNDQQKSGTQPAPPLMPWMGRAHSAAKTIPLLQNLLHYFPLQKEYPHHLR